MASTLVGAPVSKGLLLTLCGCSLLAAITTNQHYFNVPFYGHPHIFRDHQFWRFATRLFIWTNSSEVLLSVFVMWYSSLEVERIWGSRKFASFLVVMTLVSTAFEILALLLFSRSVLPSLPAGPFALTFAIVYQSHRLIPSLYTFELFHPRLLLNNRYPLYVLSFLLLTSQPPASTILGICGVLASTLYTSALPLWLRKWRIPTRVYETLGKALSPLTGQNRPYRRSNVVAYSEALVESLGGVATEVLFGTTGGTHNAAETGAGGGNAVRRRSAVQLDRPTPSQSPRTGTAPPPPPPPGSGGTRREGRLPPISGASFLSQWQAGLSGGTNQPSSERINELTAIFPHASRAEIIQALQENEMNVMRAAEALVAS